MAMSKHGKSSTPRKRQRAEKVIVYLREIDADTDNACWVVCAKGDPGAVAFTPLGYEP